MSDTAASYIMDVSYTPQFHREHAPVWLAAVLGALGRTAPEGVERNWCELGCGPGVGLTILAATNPSVTFHGIDANPSHIDEARALAKAAQLSNVAFHCIDLREEQTLPAFDCVIVQGIYSWVSPDVRAAIRQFIKSRLTPNGVALLHYLALPGAADFMAVQSLFRAVHSQSGISARQAIMTGRQILSSLHAAKAGFFAAHPVADLKVPQSADDDIDYSIHDYLNEYYTPLAAADVITTMQKEGLDFVGSASPMDNLRDFSVPRNLHDLFHAQDNIALRELIRDMAGNQFSRTDLYMKPTQPLASSHHFRALRNQWFRALPDAPGPGSSVSFSTRIGVVEGPASVFSPILERFAQGTPVSYADIEGLPFFADKPGLPNQALHAMMGAGAIHPVSRAATDSRAARRLNAVLLERYRSGHSVPALAAPALKSGLSVRPEHLNILLRGAELPAEIGRLLP